jgi:hypothetical protein
MIYNDFEIQLVKTHEIVFTTNSSGKASNLLGSTMTQSYIVPKMHIGEFDGVIPHGPYLSLATAKKAIDDYVMLLTCEQ